MQSKLDARIKVVADKVFATDPRKFYRLMGWIKQAEKNNYSPEVITAALVEFLPYAKTANPWWQYLDHIAYKVDAKLNARAHEAEHRKLKEETREAARKLFE